MLAVIETHPQPSHAPVYRALQQNLRVPVTAIYGSDFSVAGHQADDGDGALTWDADLLAGYTALFLARVASGGGTTADTVSTGGLRDMLRAVRPTAVLIAGHSPRFYRGAWLEAWRTGTAILFRGETVDDKESAGLRSQMRKRTLALAYRRCDRLLYVGQRSLAHFRDLGVARGRLEFSPYCVDVLPFGADEAARAQFRALTRRSLGFHDDQIVLLFAGTVSRHKGVDLLPAAIRNTPDALRARVALMVVGDGPQLDEVKVQTAANPAVPAVFVGRQNRRALSAFYHAADALVLPSRHSESWGAVVNEALHHGVPCIVSDRVGCVPDLIEEGRTGQVFESDSVAALALAIETAQAFVGRASIRHACREKVSHYSIRHAAEGIARAYAAVSAPVGAPV